jgi:hypothetical protein
MVIDLANSKLIGRDGVVRIEAAIEISKQIDIYSRLELGDEKAILFGIHCKDIEPEALFLIEDALSAVKGKIPVYVFVWKMSGLMWYLVNLCDHRFAMVNSKISFGAPLLEVNFHAKINVWDGHFHEHKNSIMVELARKYHSRFQRIYDVILDKIAKNKDQQRVLGYIFNYLKNGEEIATETAKDAGVLDGVYSDPWSMLGLLYEDKEIIVYR